jgi:hypothetical protein
MIFSLRQTKFFAHRKTLGYIVKNFVGFAPLLEFFNN